MRRFPIVARQGLVSKVTNLALVLLAFSDAITIALSGKPDAVDLILYDYTGGKAGKYAGSQGSAVDVGALTKAYGPVAASFVLYEVKKELLRRMPVRA